MGRADASPQFELLSRHPSHPRETDLRTVSLDVDQRVGIAELKP